jgi:biotin synthase
MDHHSFIDKALQGDELDHTQLETLLRLQGDEVQHLFDGAQQGRVQWVGENTYFRGLIECSNICVKDCYYCGIRKSIRSTQRYEMDEDEIVKEAEWAHREGYGSIVIQAGERQDDHFISMIERVLSHLHQNFGDTLGITLSLGEQKFSTYRRWKEAGAHRYLLRVETSNPELYRSLHPSDHNHQERFKCLQDLKELGYQVGTGIMSGLPGQTYTDLINDLFFMKKIDVDMVGLGPFIPHSETPLYHDKRSRIANTEEESLSLGLKMVALTRLYLKDVNIAAATALQSLHPKGREKALQAGANVIMPNLTLTTFRSHYSLYENKPCTGEAASQCKGCLSSRIHLAGGKIALGKRGDSVHYLKRTEQLTSV